jgi:hypothetical protein|nr:MAG TPA_asm: hypothetical protein [Caudoviricetes sp.]
MSVYLSDDELQQFQDNGITQDDIKNTVDYCRNEGLSDEEIRAKVDTKLKSFNTQNFENNNSQDNSSEDSGEPLTPQNGMITGGITFDWDKAKEDIKTNPQETGLKILAESRRKDPILQGLKGGLQSISAPFVEIGKSFTNKVLRPLAGKKPLTDEELDKAYGWVDDKPQGMGKASALGTDLAITFGLPEIKAFQGAGLGAKIGNSVLTNAYQGGLIGGVEDLRQGGNGFGGATIGALGGGALGTAMPLTGAAISKLLPRAGASIAGVSTDTIRQAIKPNSRALDLNPDQAQSLLLDTTQNVRNAYNNLLSKRGQAVNDAIDNLRGNEYRVPLEDLKSDIKSTFDQYGGELINPARNMTGGLERNLNELVSGGTSDPRATLGLDKEITTNFIENPYFSKEKQAEAYDIVGRALGKDGNWVKSRLNDPQYRGVKTQSEKLDMLLRESEKLAEKEANTGELGSQIYNHYNYNGENASPEAAEELINTAYNDIVNNNFITNNIDPLTRNINEAELSYRQLLNNVVNNANDQNIYVKAGDDLYNIVKNLPEDVQGSFYERLGNDLDTIYNKTQTISPIDLQKAKQQIGHMVNWSDETARNYQNPILEQIYNKYNRRLSDLSPELEKANRQFANLRSFQKNEGLNRILKTGNNIDSASSALKNYNSTVTKGNTGRNIKDLENILVANGSEPFLNTVDDINAAMDLNKSITTGRNFGGVTDLAKSLLIDPTLRMVRAINKSRFVKTLNNLRDNVNPSIIQLLYGVTRPFSE